jgi:hypothetical protein
MADEFGTTKEKTPTDYEQLAAHIAEMEADQARGGFNLWRQQSINSLKRELERWFDEEGNKVEPEYDPHAESDNCSPAEVQGAPGWYEQQGIEVSVARSNGCVRVRALYDTAIWYRDHAQEVADQCGASVRIIRMVGEALSTQEWYMLPTHEIKGGGSFNKPYVPLQPEVPFNEAECELWKANFVRSHFTAASVIFGGNLESGKIIRKKADGAEEIIEGHYIWTIVNSPHAIIPALAKRYQGKGWLQRKYLQMIGYAHQIDRGTMGRIAGYSKPFDQGGPEVQDSKDMANWYNTVEDGHVLKQPRLPKAPRS